jgi:hypothetical protein
MKRTLHLSLKKKPFDVMVTGEKTKEYRIPSNWIKSRLFEKTYDLVKCVNGYGFDKPYFIAKYLGFYRTHQDSTKTFSNGLVVEIKDGDFIIQLGEIVQKGNLNQINL